MYNSIGNCPHCGAPIYVQSPWWAVTPPPPVYSCDCKQDMRTLPQRVKDLENYPRKTHVVVTTTETNMEDCLK